MYFLVLYLILFIISAVGVWLGYRFAIRKTEDCDTPQQSKNKKQNKKKILEFLQNNKQAKTKDIEKLLNVSSSTAERYLNELEKEGIILQNGKTGRSVFYTLTQS